MLKMIPLLCLSSLFVIAAGARVSDGCSSGPSYWCQDIPTAARCGAMKHCIDTVWKNQRLPKNGTEVCTFCKQIVTDARKFLTDPQTESMVKTYLQRACAVIPDKQLAQQCDKLLTDYADQVFQLIKSELNPDAICATMGLCSGFKDTKLYFKPRKPVNKVTTDVSTSTVCEACEKSLTELKKVVTEKTTQEDVENFLIQNLCPRLEKSLQDLCKQVVKMYGQEVFELLSKDLKPAEICEKIGFCKAEFHRLALIRSAIRHTPLYHAAVKVRSSGFCLYCKLVMEEIRELDRNPQAQKDIKTFLKQHVCSKLGKIKKECVSTVDQYAPLVFEFLANELDPSARCTELGLCSVEALESNLVSLGMSLPTLPVLSDVKIGPSAECVLCEFVIKELVTLLAKNATEQEIIAALDKVCSLLPDTLKNQCKDFINTYGQGIIDLLKQELDPNLICRSLSLCKALKVSASGASCGVCETVVQYADALLDEPSTEQDVERALEKVCSHVPKDFTKECDSLVKQYTPMLLKLLVQYADPKQVCTELGLCKQKSVKEQKIVPGKVTLLGEKECSWGPKYWCSNVHTAVNCRAVDYCKKKIWKKNIP